MSEPDPLSPHWPPALAADPDWKAAIAMGIDVHLIEANLRLTPAERVRQHTKMLELAGKLRCQPSAIGTPKRSGSSIG